MSEIYALLGFLYLSSNLVPADLLAHLSVYPIIDRYLSHTFTIFTALLHIVTICAFFYAGFTLFIALLCIVTFRYFYFILL